MSSQRLFEIALKVLGVLCIVWGIQLAGSLVGFTKRGDATWIERWLPFTLSLLLFILATILLLGAKVFAQKLVPHSDEIHLTLGENQSAYTLALRIIGTVLIVEAIPRIAVFILGMVAYRTRTDFYYPRQLEYLAPAVVQLLLALYLLFGAKRFVAFVMKGSMRER